MNTSDPSPSAPVPDRPERRTPARRLFEGRVSERRLEILEAAALLFGERGYAATSMRDIARRVGLLGGSLYHHIRSKEELFAEIHDLALEGVSDLIRQRVESASDPWERLELACLTMLEEQLTDHSITLPLMNDFRAVPPDLRVRLVPKRDAFEAVFADLVADLPLADGLDRTLFRIMLLTELNNVSAWYQPGGKLSPAEIAHQIVRVFRDGGAVRTAGAG
ncbi:TetR/AcrR family transcriptional regulator [Segnochrobactraceae bacterium EtOH-i3]